MKKRLANLNRKFHVPVLVLHILFSNACQTQSHANLVSDVTVSNQMIQGIEFETHCIGRYQMQMVKGLAPRSVFAKFDGFKIKRLAVNPTLDLKGYLEQKKVEMDVAAKQKSYPGEVYEEKVVGDHSAYIAFKAVSDGAKIVGYKNISTGIYEFSIIDDIEFNNENIKLAISILNNMKPLEGPPTQPGFCLPGAIIHLDPGELKEVSQLIFKDFPEPGTYWDLDMTGYLSSLGEEHTPKVRAKGIAKYGAKLFEEEGLSYDDIEIRFRRLKLNGRPGYEWLIGLENSGEYTFSWRGWGEQDNVQKPDIIFTFATNNQSSLPNRYTQEQVIAIWERILSSVKLHAGEQTRTVGKPK